MRATVMYGAGDVRIENVPDPSIIEAITHLAFYAGWPEAIADMIVAKRVFRGDAN